jgi:hypothetical protein
VSSTFSNTTTRNVIRAIAVIAGNLSELCIGGLDLGDKGLAEFISTHAAGSLKKLDVRSNFIGELGCESLVAGVRAGKFSSLECLFLDGNILTDRCIQILVTCIREMSMQRFHYLGLEDNFIESQGIHEISKFCRTNF